MIDGSVNKKVVQLFQQLQALSHPYITDLVPAYSSLAVYYNLPLVYARKGAYDTAFESMAQLIDTLAGEGETPSKTARSLQIPVCYASAFGPDLPFLSRQCGLGVEDIIRLHTSVPYKVYMLGFLPGFAYMGKVDDRLAIPRKPSPLPVAAGSVGIAGSQTGVYPLDSPGGWQIIGRTPFRLFNAAREPAVALQPGDEVTFYSITEDEFANY